MPFAAGQQLFPADLVTPDAWQSYALSWTGATTNPVIGNGTITARYIKPTAHTVAVSVVIFLGSTSTKGSGAYSFSLPVALGGAAANGGCGSFWLNDSGISFRTGVVIAATTTTVQLYVNGAGAPVSDTTLTGTFTASKIVFEFIYEV